MLKNSRECMEDVKRQIATERKNKAFKTLTGKNRCVESARRFGDALLYFLCCGEPIESIERSIRESYEHHCKVMYGKKPPLSREEWEYIVRTELEG